MGAPHFYRAGIKSALLAGFAALLSVPPSTQAATWDNGAGTVNWSDATNWNPETGLVLAGDTLVFGVAGVSGTSLINDIVGQVVTGMTFNAGAPAWTLNGNGVTFSGTIVSTSTEVQTINLPLNLAGNATISAAASIVLGGAIGQGGTAGNRTITNNLTNGLLTLAGTLSLADGSPRVFTITGHRDTLISGAIQNGGAGAGSLIQQGAGTVTLSGNNSFTGTLTVQGGSVILDYSGGNDPLGPTATANLFGGNLTLKGQAVGSTVETIASLNLGSGTAATSRLVLAANGGSGINLTIGNLTSDGAVLQALLIDTSSSAANSITATLGNNFVLTNGILQNNPNTRAGVLVKDTTGVGFATISSATAGTISKLSNTTALPTASSGSSTANYLHTGAGGSITVGTGTAFASNTITIDTTTASATLDLAAGTTIGSGGAGSGFLARGSNDVTINTAGGANTFNAGTWLIHNYLTGTAALRLNGNLSSTATELISGPGLTIYSGTGFSNASPNGFNLTEGILRVTTAQDWSTAGTTGLSNGAGNGIFRNGGVLELAADMNGATAGDFSNAISSAGPGANQIQFIGNSGVSAFGGNRSFNFGGAAGTLVWGSGGFLVSPGTTITDGDHILRLSTAFSDSTVEIVNPINLNSRIRVIEVANGTADLDARLTGALSNGGMEKTGTGTLVLTGTSTYVSETRISAGVLQIGDGGATGSLSASSSIVNNATLIFKRSTFSVGNAISGTGAVIQDGPGTTTLNGAGSNTYTGLTTVNSGGLTLTKTGGATAITGNLTVGAATLTNGGNEQIANSATVTLTAATTFWTLGGFSETIANLDIQNAGPLVNLGLLTGTAGKLTVTDTLTHTLGNITLNSSGASGQSSITANRLVNTGGDWLFGTGSGTQSLVIGPGGLLIGGGSTIAVGATATSLNFIRLSGDVTSQAAATSNTLSSSSTAFSRLILEGTRIFDVANGAATDDLVIGNAVTDGTAVGGLTKSGAGNLSLTGTGANTYTGLTTINAGILTLNKTTAVNAIAGNILIGAGTLTQLIDEQVANTATVTLNNAIAKWDIASRTETVANVTMQNAGATVAQGLQTGINGKLIVVDTLTHTLGNITLNSSSVGNQTTITTNRLINTGGEWTFGVNSGTQSLVIGAGGLTIGGGSTLNANAAVAAANFIRLSGDVTSQASATTNTISDAGSGLTQLRLEGTRTMTVANGAATNDLTVAMAITDGVAPGGLTKDGAGKLLLSGLNSYTGPTNVAEGTLELTGSISGSSAISVTGGTLLLSNATTPVATSQALTLGSSANSTSGLLQLGNSLNNVTESFGILTLDYHSTLDFGNGAGGQDLSFSDFDRNGTAKLSITNFTFNGTPGTANDRLIFTSGTIGDFMAAFGQADVSFNGINGYSAAVLGGGYEIFAVPEPSSTALIGVALIGLGGFRRMGRRSRREASVS